MQNTDLTQFDNKSGWTVIHDNETNMYVIKNANGNKRPGFFTSRRFAEKSLFDYLTVLTEPARAKAAREASKPVLRQGPRGPQKKVLIPGKDRVKKINPEQTEAGKKILDSLKEHSN